jgi:hypothetical protein
MKTNLFLIGTLIAALVLSSAIAIDSSTQTGKVTDDFTTATPVYVMHAVTVYCNTEIIDQTLDVYIVPDKNWTVGENITGSILNTTIKTDSKGKIPATLIWDKPVIGAYDIIVDLNKNGKYDSSDTCTDLLDDNTKAGFTVTAAGAENNNTHTNNTTNVTNNTAVHNATTTTTAVNKTTTPTATTTVTNATGTTAQGTDYTPFIIILIAIIIAVVIVVITLRNLR